MNLLHPKVPWPVLALLIPLPAWAAALQQRVAYEQYTLPNGMRVILAEDHSTPIVTVNIWYNVGSRNERAGRSGFAHLFEHMMFQGSAHVKKGEHFQLIERAGGTMNGTTDEDRTAYFETLPANRLNLGLWLEADRMRSLAVTAENFENQRQAVKEERRLRVDNQPYAPALVDGIAMLYDSTDCFAYAHSVIGSMADLDAAQVEDVKAFFDLYYAPNNATLTVVGDFDPGEAKRLIQEYFGDIPKGADPPPVECRYRFDVGAMRKTWEDQHANLPAVIIAYRAPPHDHADTPALQHLSTILGGGESSRLHRSLVRNSKIAFGAGSQFQSRRGPGVIAVFALANQGVTAEALERQLLAEVARVRDQGVSEEEVTKARNDYRAGTIFGLQTTMSVSQQLQHYAHYHSSLEEMHSEFDKYLSVTGGDIQRVARTYLVPENSLTITVVPKGGANP